MKTIKIFPYGRKIVWMKKGEEFPGTTLKAKQGFYELFFGSNNSDWRSSRYLGPRMRDIHAWELM